jgi:NADH-quinone oxidoreductase subunit J
MGSFIVFYILAAVILISAVLAVTSKRMLRAAAFLLFVLVATAGLYLLLNYHFLAAVQLSVYAGGILVLFIFAILLTSGAKGDHTEQTDKRKALLGILTAVGGIAITGTVLLKHRFLYSSNPTIEGDQEINMKVIGNALMGTEKYQYLLPFEVLSVLLLACIIGSILIARKR